MKKEKLKSELKLKKYILEVYLKNATDDEINDMYKYFTKKLKKRRKQND